MCVLASGTIGSLRQVARHQNRQMSDLPNKSGILDHVNRLLWSDRVPLLRHPMCQLMICISRRACDRFRILARYVQHSPPLKFDSHFASFVVSVYISYI